MVSNQGPGEVTARGEEGEREIYLSRDPGVITGVSPTLRLVDFLDFFSKYFFASAESLALYSFSIRLLSR